MHNEQLSAITQTLASSGLPAWDDLPDLELYMDQVVTYLKRQLSAFVDNPSGNLVTPSVVNNYVKAGVAPRPVKKKYGRPQLSALTMACFLKGVMPSQSIKTLVMRDGHAPDEAYHRDFTSAMKDVMRQEAEFLTELTAGGEVDRDQLFSMAMCFSMRANADRYIADRLIELIEGREAK